MQLNFCSSFFNPPPMKYLVHFAQSHPNFRLAELRSVAQMFNIGLEEVDLEGHQLDSPFLVLELSCSEPEIKLILGRCILIRAIYVLYGSSESGFSHMVNEIKGTVNDISDLKLFPPNGSFKFMVETFNHTLDSATQLEMINSFAFLPIGRRVNLKNPDMTFAIVSDYQMALKKGLAPKFRQVFMGRLVGVGRRDLIEKYSLKKRKYVGTTSMESEISLVSANMVQAREGMLILDPFMGTGSFLLTCSEFGAYTMGSELDGRKLRRLDAKSPCFADNIVQYGLQSRILDTLVFDVKLMPFSDRLRFDAIVTDPPYGVREGARKIAASSVPSPPDQLFEQERAVTRFPDTEAYEVEDVISDLVEMAARKLNVGGRLAYWHPVSKDSS